MEAGEGRADVLGEAGRVVRGDPRREGRPEQCDPRLGRDRCRSFGGSPRPQSRAEGFGQPGQFELAARLPAPARQRRGSASCPCVDGAVVGESDRGLGSDSRGATVPDDRHASCTRDEQWGSWYVDMTPKPVGIYNVKAFVCEIYHSTSNTKNINDVEVSIAAFCDGVAGERT
ncbi:hypothetical protein [Herbidospora galbida]|uniref:hypothetical protein n=1 Tax=Herbidospora galbida TaxID=2575442 RepID=UPI001BAEB500|nr:hypothetical protein [Herbidospora galbida]